MQPQEQINSYIAEHPEWQRRLMARFRQLIRATEPEVIGLMRGNVPAFDHEGPMLSMHALKTCVSIWFNKGALLKDPDGLFQLTDKDEERAVRKYKVEEGGTIHEKAFTDLLKQAVKLNEAAAKGSESKTSKNTLVVPPELESCLKKDEDAWEHWENFKISHKKEYVEWIEDAANEETRKRRIAQALGMIREGVGKLNDHKV